MPKMCCRILKLVLATYFLLTQPYLLHANQFRFLAECQPTGYLRGTATANCNTENDSECCEANKSYPQYYCSPQVTSSTRAIMTLNSFAEGGDGGGPSECDGRYHSDSESVVALSTGWYNRGSRCGKRIRNNGNERSVLAKVVDECDSVHGCDAEHSYQPPCGKLVIISSMLLRPYGRVWVTQEMKMTTGMFKLHGLMPEHYLGACVYEPCHAMSSVLYKFLASNSNAANAPNH